VDFMLGAACSSDGLGKPIVAMTSVTPSGESKIVPQFKPGALQHYSLDINSRDHGVGDIKMSAASDAV